MGELYYCVSKIFMCSDYAILKLEMARRDVTTTEDRLPSGPRTCTVKARRNRCLIARLTGVSTPATAVPILSVCAATRTVSFTTFTQSKIIQNFCI